MRPAPSPLNSSQRVRRVVVSCLALSALGSTCAAVRPPAADAAAFEIGRTATPAEVKAWDIDVGGDFQGLPPGSGSAALGAKVWDDKCASCHGAFGESNDVFTPIVGGTSAQDIESGRVYFLAHPGYPHRTTLMKASKLSSLWDYIRRAMPWNAPKSLTNEEVYAVLAYVLSLGAIVPADFTLSDKNIAEVQARLPNRAGKVFYREMWLVRGKGDVTNPPCMTGCPVQGKIESELPESVRGANGNIAEQVRPFGPARGTDTAERPLGEALAIATAAAAVTPPAVDLLLRENNCTACHGVADRSVGPAFREVAAKHASRGDAVDYLMNKIRKGGQGSWGVIPMPEQAQVKESDARAIAQWLATGAK